jgi:hypothetical protein
MFNLCCTAKLLSQLKAVAEAPAESTTRLGNWYGNLFVVGQQQWAMFTSERSLLTVILPAGEISPLPGALAASVRRVLADMEAPPALVEDEIARMQACVFAPTASRSVLGSMNDLIFSAKIHLSESPPLPLFELQRRLAETPMKPLNYRYPREAALELLASAAGP